jgi:hypothetical protein
VLLVALAAALVQAKPQGENVHSPDARCDACHTADATVLKADPDAARRLLAPDLEARCLACHADEGPSHATGIVPHSPPPAALPLSADGRITCATCHYMHGESNAFGDFVRIDNRHGGLCLTCHQLSELQ